MRLYQARACALALLPLLSTSGCEQTKSANPLSPDVAGPLPGVLITAPHPLEPGLGAALLADSGTVTLVLQNPETNGPRPLWLDLQVATDGGFGHILHQADRLTPGTDGRTTHRIPQALGSGHTYYWRARARDGANEGPFSSVAHFSVVAPVTLETPMPLEPSGAIAGNKPEFRVRNGGVSGPAGSVMYRFEVGTAPDPAAITAVVTVPAAASGTTSMSLGELPLNRQFFWRVYATNGEANSAYSQVISFRTPAPAPPPAAPPPPVVPPPSGGPVGALRAITAEEALAIIRNVHDSERWDLGSRSSREQRVQFLFRAVAAIHYGHSRFNPRGPDANWCVKDAGGGRPPSDDVIVRCDSRDAWDVVGGAGADGYRFHLDFIGRLPGGQNVYPPPRSALP